MVGNLNTLSCERNFIWKSFTINDCKLLSRWASYSAIHFTHTKNKLPNYFLLSLQ